MENVCGRALKRFDDWVWCHWRADGERRKLKTCFEIRLPSPSDNFLSTVDLMVRFYINVWFISTQTCSSKSDRKMLSGWKLEEIGESSVTKWLFVHGSGGSIWTTDLWVSLSDQRPYEPSGLTWLPHPYRRRHGYARLSLATFFPATSILKTKCGLNVFIRWPWKNL